ncbi:MAG: nucleotide exchange factor GrpE [Planctomycetaceae bacterium]|jgi:molecular chaperone GrpE (heat shock protein)|nr:nucleotide exchange factor GrpE [Planctomycetaceae bacterium]
MSDEFDKYSTSFDRLMKFSVGREFNSRDELEFNTDGGDEFSDAAVNQNNTAEATNDDVAGDIDLANRSDEFAPEVSDNIVIKLDNYGDDEISNELVEGGIGDELAEDVIEIPVERMVTELSRQNANILEQFTGWLYSSGEEFVDADDKLDEFDKESYTGLFNVYEALSAQRHELKLYAKSGRKTAELIEKSIEATERNIDETARVVEQLARFKRERPEIERKAIKPFIMSLVEIDESLMRAVSFLESVQSRLIFQSRNLEIYASAYCDGLSIFQRLWRRKTVMQFTEYLIKERIGEIAHVLQPLQDGFKMVTFRMDDVLRKHAISRISPTVGDVVNPETMQVLAILDSDKIKPGHVVDVVRPGYFWQGRPLRYADVRAARIVEN